MEKQELENLKTEGAGVEGKPKTAVKTRFSAKRIALMAVFVALAYAVSFLEIPIFPAAPFLKLDFGNAFILLVGFLLGPVEGIVVCLLKESLRAIGSSSGGVGEIANILMTSAYILLPTVVYRFKKGFLTVLWTLAVGCVLGTGMALVANRFITFPLYMGEGAAAAFASLGWFVLAFNLIKTVAVSALTLLLYKRLSKFLKKLKI